MINISFHANWDEDDKEFSNSIKRQTPSESSIWGDIQGTDDKSLADCHVVFNNPRNDLEMSRSLLFSAEPPVSNAYTGWDEVDVLGKFPIESYYKPQRWLIDKTYDELVEQNPPGKSRPLSWITTDKGKDTGILTRKSRKLCRSLGWTETARKNLPVVGRWPFDGHILRMEFYERLISTYPGLVDLYGRGDFSGSHYHGEIEDKWTGLNEYQYTLAIENYKGPNYFSEKISDALLAWCMPIYWGCTNLPDYFPENSYVWIDIEDPEAPEQIKTIVNSDLREQNIDAIAEARRRILNRYQIWPTVERTVKRCISE